MPSKKKDPGLVEAALAPLIERWGSIRDERLQYERKVAELKKLENDYEAQVAPLLERGKLTRAASTHFSVKKEEVTEYDVDSWENLYAHILRTGEFDLLHRRLTKTAVEEREADGGKVPGTVSRKVTKVKINRIKS